MPALQHRRCENCGEKYRGYGKQYCSYVCMGQHKAAPPKVCAECGHAYTGRNLRYCSAECMTIAYVTTEKSCVVCGETFRAASQRVDRRHCSVACAAVNRRGASNASWSGGRHVSPAGYVRISLGGGNRALEHRVVMERALGRPLRSDEHVHHVDGDKQNNEVGNLRVLSVSEHGELHSREYWHGAGNTTPAP